MPLFGPSLRHIWRGLACSVPVQFAGELHLPTDFPQALAPPGAKDLFFAP